MSIVVFTTNKINKIIHCIMMSILDIVEWILTQNRQSLCLECSNKDF